MKKIILTFILLFICFYNCSVYAANDLYTSSLDGEISMHIAKDESSYIITKIPACSKIKLIEVNETWGKVVFQKKCGWINLSFTSDTYMNAAENTGNDSVHYVKVKTETGSTQLYNVPSTDEILGSEVKYTVPDETVLNITRETDSGWGLVHMNTKLAWVQLKDTENYAPRKTDNRVYGIYYVYSLSKDGIGVPLCSNEDGSGEVLAVIPDCIKLTVRSENEKKTFGYVSYNGLNGWIDLSQTATSQANAQSNAGTSINGEYIVVSPEKEVDMLSVPSFEVHDGGFCVSSVKSGETVFVLRGTQTGWSLIIKDGVKGWLPPESLMPKEASPTEKVEILSPYSVFAATKKSKGAPLYSSFDEDKKQITVVPECTELTMVTKNGNFAYVYSDYAAGWIELSNTAESYEAARDLTRDEKPSYVIVDEETTLRSIPVYSEICKSAELDILPVGTMLMVVRTVTTGERKWLLTEFNGKMGWVNRNCTEKTLSPKIIILIVIGGAIVLFALIVLIVYLIKKFKKRPLKLWFKKGSKEDGE